MIESLDSVSLAECKMYSSSVGLRHVAINIEVSGDLWQNEFQAVQLFVQDDLTACRKTIQGEGGKR